MLALADFLKVSQSTFAVGNIFEREQQCGLTDSDAIVVLQWGLVVNFVAVDKDAVLALHIDCIVLVLVGVETNLHVLAGDVGVNNLDWHGLIPTDYIGPAAEGVVITLVGS